MLAAWVVPMLLLAVVAVSLGGRSKWFPMYARVRGKRTVEEALAQFGAGARERLGPHLAAAGVADPPQHATLLGFKSERRLELWAGERGVERFVRSWPMLAASGVCGPKLREGDRQVPEGRYRIAALNPNSSYHLSLELDYPNDLDRARAADEARDPGGQIFIHGKDKSIGCIAIGDEAIEELFTFVARVGIEHVDVILAPRDLRDGIAADVPSGAPRWTSELYADLAMALASYPPARADERSTADAH